MFIAFRASCISGKCKRIHYASRQAFSPEIADAVQEFIATYEPKRDKALMALKNPDYLASRVGITHWCQLSPALQQANPSYQVRMQSGDPPPNPLSGRAGNASAAAVGEEDEDEEDENDGEYAYTVHDDDESDGEGGDEGEETFEEEYEDEDDGRVEAESSSERHARRFQALALTPEESNPVAMATLPSDGSNTLFCTACTCLFVATRGTTSTSLRPAPATKPVCFYADKPHFAHVPLPFNLLANPPPLFRLLSLPHGGFFERDVLPTAATKEQDSANVALAALAIRTQTLRSSLQRDFTPSADAVVFAPKEGSSSSGGVYGGGGFEGGGGSGVLEGSGCCGGVFEGGGSNPNLSLSVETLDQQLTDPQAQYTQKQQQQNPSPCFSWHKKFETGHGRGCPSLPGTCPRRHGTRLTLHEESRVVCGTCGQRWCNGAQYMQKYHSLVCANNGCQPIANLEQLYWQLEQPQEKQQQQQVEQYQQRQQQQQQQQQEQRPLNSRAAGLGSSTTLSATSGAYTPTEALPVRPQPQEQDRHQQEAAASAAAVTATNSSHRARAAVVSSSVPPAAAPLQQLNPAPPLPTSEDGNSLRSAGCRQPLALLAPAGAAPASFSASTPLLLPPPPRQPQPQPLAPFKLERFFAQYEFTAPHLLCCSDCEALGMGELLRLACPEMLRAWEGLQLGYTESRGWPLLLREIEKCYEDLDFTAVAVNAVPASSTDDPSSSSPPLSLTPLVAAPQECLFLAVHAMLKPGDTVVVMYPGYQSLYEVALSLGCTVLWWSPDYNPATSTSTASNKPTTGSGGKAAAGYGATYSLTTLRALIQNHLSGDDKPSKRIDAIVVNFPHNPTGFTPTTLELGSLVEICRSHDCFLFGDEMYRGLELKASRALPSVVECGYHKAVALGGVSKALSLPGLRIGWLVSTHAPTLQRCVELKDYTTICSSAPSEVLATIALRNRETLLQRNLDTTKHNLQLLRAFFARHSSKFSWAEPIAGTVCFPRLLTTSYTSGKKKGEIKGDAEVVAANTTPNGASSSNDNATSLSSPSLSSSAPSTSSSSPLSSSNTSALFSLSAVAPSPPPPSRGRGRGLTSAFGSSSDGPSARDRTVVGNEAGGEAAQAAAAAEEEEVTLLDVEAYCVSLVERHGILLLPATVYVHQPPPSSVTAASTDLSSRASPLPSSPPPLPPCFRLGFGRKNFPDVLSLWEAAILEDENQ